MAMGGARACERLSPRQADVAELSSGGELVSFKGAVLNQLSLSEILNDEITSSREFESR